MRILFLVGAADCNVPTEAMSPLGIRSTATVYHYFLRTELSRFPGVETAAHPFRKFKDQERARAFLDRLEPPVADHVVCLEQRGFAAAAPNLFGFYREHIPGAVCAICDHDEVLGPEDYLFHVQPSARVPPSPKSVHVTWAAAPQFCYPEKEPGVLNILVDHHNYSGGDKVHEIRASLARFARETFPVRGPRYGFDRLVVRQFVSGGIAIVDPARPYQPDDYDRKGVSFPEACREYRRCDIFMVTKPESMGLSMIECAMSGALIVVPRGYGHAHLLDPLNHFFWDEDIDWHKVLALLDVDISVDAASAYNWHRLAQRMLTILRCHPSRGRPH